MATHIGVGIAGDVRVTLTAEIDFAEGMPTALRSDAEDRVALVLRREAQRMAEISYVDALDAMAEPVERERIRNADPNRSYVVVSAGTRDGVANGKIKLEDAVQVLRGSIEAHGQTLSEKGGAA